MEKRVKASAAQRQLGKILDEVVCQRESYILEREGRPVAVVVPIEVYEQWKEARRVFLARVKTAAERGDLTQEEAEALAEL